MAAITWTDVTNAASELSVVSAAHRVAILAYVNGVGVNVDVFDGENGNDTFLARVYLAAHFGALAVRESGSAVGAVTSESVGGLQRAYGNSSASSGDSLLDKTTYGQLFRFLLSRVAPGAFVV